MTSGLSDGYFLEAEGRHHSQFRDMTLPDIPYSIFGNKVAW